MLPSDRLWVRPGASSHAAAHDFTDYVESLVQKVRDLHGDGVTLAQLRHFVHAEATNYADFDGGMYLLVWSSEAGSNPGTHPPYWVTRSADFGAKAWTGACNCHCLSLLVALLAARFETPLRLTRMLPGQSDDHSQWVRKQHTDLQLDGLHVDSRPAQERSHALPEWRPGCIHTPTDGEEMLYTGLLLPSEYWVLVARHDYHGETLCNSKPTTEGSNWLRRETSHFVHGIRQRCTVSTRHDRRKRLSRIHTVSESRPGVLTGHPSFSH